MASLFWEDRGEAQARASVRQSLGELRNLARGVDPAILIDQVSITAISKAIDNRADQLGRLAGLGDVDTIEAILSQGDGFLTGLDAISPPFDDWLRTERANAYDALARASIAAGHRAVDRGQAESAQRLIGRLQVIDPLDERLARAGFEIDAAAADVVSLERRFRALAKVLQDELGVEPSTATLGAYHAAAAKLHSPEAPRGFAGPAPDLTVSPVAKRHASARRTFALIAAVLVVVAGFAILRVLPDLKVNRGPPPVIAVLPLRAAEDQQILADGVWEEIVTRLSRNPGIAVFGRDSSRLIDEESGDIAGIGRQLHVNYLLRGQVRRGGGRTALGVTLVRTADGSKVWAHNLASADDDILTMIDTIGSLVPRRMGAKNLPVPSKKRRPRDDAYQLYLTSLGLLQNFEPQKVSTAVELLHKAVRLDPDFGPAWSLLGSATRTQSLQNLHPGIDDRNNQRALAYARRGLELAPNAADANVAMGVTLAEDPRALPYLLRAVRLEPSNAGTWMALFETYDLQGDFRQAMGALMRAVHIDPLAQLPAFTAADWSWNMGQRDQAIRLSTPIFRHGSPQPYLRHMIRGHFAERRGDLSLALREYALAGASADSGSRIWADLLKGSVYYMTGMLDQARPLVATFRLDDEEWAMWHGRLPSQGEVEISRAYPGYAWNMRERNYRLLRILLNQGRATEVAALYDRRFKSPEEFAQTLRGHVSFVGDSVPVIIALREVGRRQEAQRIHDLAAAAVTRRFKAGPVPNWYEALAAQLWAIGGQEQRAVDGVNRAIARGWLYRSGVSLPDIADEPAYRSLTGSPRFQAAKRRLDSLTMRERAEILADAQTS